MRMKRQDRLALLLRAPFDIPLQYRSVLITGALFSLAGGAIGMRLFNSNLGAGATGLAAYYVGLEVGVLIYGLVPDQVLFFAFRLTGVIFALDSLRLAYKALAVGLSTHNPVLAAPVSFFACGAIFMLTVAIAPNLLLSRRGRILGVIIVGFSLASLLAFLRTGRFPSALAAAACAVMAVPFLARRPRTAPNLDVAQLLWPRAGSPQSPPPSNE